ncbi:hypothetical protein TNCV_1600331 [Trichonephila clavipes]|nr:hypothetical protein TNCV_1600331 [Trichonephila clavipes]
MLIEKKDGGPCVISQLTSNYMRSWSTSCDKMVVEKGNVARLRDASMTRQLVSDSIANYRTIRLRHAVPI